MVRMFIDKLLIMGRNKVIYWLFTGVMCLIFALSASMYFVKYEMVRGFFEELNYPVYIIYPLAIAKILGIVAILSNRSKLLKEWAYAGFFFDSVLAIAAHHFAGHGFGLSIIALIAVVGSRYMESKIQ